MPLDSEKQRVHSRVNGLGRERVRAILVGYGFLSFDGQAYSDLVHVLTELILEEVIPEEDLDTDWREKA